MNTQENKQLRSCPFCGSPVNSNKGARGTMFFKCTNKKSCGAVIFFENDYYERYPEEAYHRYNRRAELEQLQHKYDLAVAEREANVKGFTEELAKAKTDTVREIFADIERIIGESRTSEYSKEFGFLDRSYYNGAMIVQELDKLKKKYTGANNDRGLL